MKHTAGPEERAPLHRLILAAVVDMPGGGGRVWQREGEREREEKDDEREEQGEKEWD